MNTFFISHLDLCISEKPFHFSTGFFVMLKIYLQGLLFQTKMKLMGILVFLLSGKIFFNVGKYNLKKHTKKLQQFQNAGLLATKECDPRLVETNEVKSVKPRHREEYSTQSPESLLRCGDIGERPGTLRLLELPGKVMKNCKHRKL